MGNPIGEVCPEMKRAFGWFIIALAIVVWLQLLFGPRSLGYLLSLEIERRVLREEISEISRKNEALEEEIRRIREDPLYLERLARRELGLVRKGEILFIVVEGGDEVRRGHLPTAQ